MLLQKQIVREIEENYIYAIEDEETKQIVEVKHSDVKRGKKYYKLAVVAGG